MDLGNRGPGTRDRDRLAAQHAIDHLAAVISEFTNRNVTQGRDGITRGMWVSQSHQGERASGRRLVKFGFVATAPARAIALGEAAESEVSDGYLEGASVVTDLEMWWAVVVRAVVRGVRCW
jgi:hypothetical protein